MGVTAADFDHDGLLDIFKTNFADDTHTLYRNLGGNNFDDATIASGLAVNTKYLGWGTAFLDIDNDGWKDLIVANGHVYPEVDSGRTAKNSSKGGSSIGTEATASFLISPGASGPGISDEHSSEARGRDLDNDGNWRLSSSIWMSRLRC